MFLLSKNLRGRCVRQGLPGYGGASSYYLNGLLAYRPRLPAV
jgi:hypothetical protein